MAQTCKNLASTVSDCISYLESLSAKITSKENVYQNGDSCKSNEYVVKIRDLLENISSLTDRVGGQDDTGASDSVEGELANMDKVIEEAASRIEVIHFYFHNVINDSNSYFVFVSGHASKE